MAVSLAQLVIGARTAANMQRGGPWTPPEWDSAANRALEAFYVDCAAVNNTWKVSVFPFVIVLTTAPFTLLPANFANALKVVRDPGTSQRRPLRRASDEIVETGEMTYRIEDQQLLIDPLEQAPGNYELRYTPTPTMLTAQVGLDAELAPHREYFELHMARSALTSEQSPTGDLKDRFVECKTRATVWAQSQRSSEPNIVRDVRPRGVALRR